MGRVADLEEQILKLQDNYKELQWSAQQKENDVLSKNNVLGMSMEKIKNLQALLNELEKQKTIKFIQ